MSMAKQSTPYLPFHCLLHKVSFKVILVLSSRHAVLSWDVFRAFVGDPRVRKKNSEFLIGVLLS